MKSLYAEMATVIRDCLTDHETEKAARDRVSKFARKVADHSRRSDPAFDYGWFFGACGLDNWGEPLPPSRLPGRGAHWDPDLGDFRFD